MRGLVRLPWVWRFLKAFYGHMRSAVFLTLLIIFPPLASADCWVMDITPRDFNPPPQQTAQALIDMVVAHIKATLLPIGQMSCPLPWYSVPPGPEPITSYYVTQGIDTWGASVTIFGVGPHGQYCSGVFVTMLNGSIVNSVPQCMHSYGIKLSRPDGSSEDNTTLDKIEPGKPSTLVARVYDQNNQLVPGVDVQLTAGVIHGSGGHSHGDDQLIARTGSFSSPDSTATVQSGGQILSGNTGQSGLTFIYKAPEVSGDNTIAAICTGAKNCTPQGPNQVWVGRKGMETLRDSQYYVLVGDTPNHFTNHYLIPEAINQVYALTALYQAAKLPSDPLLHLNDASLERGGVFDLLSDWAPPHFEHCRGTEVDVRANDTLGAIPERNYEIFEESARTVGARAMFEIPRDKSGNALSHLRHYHVRMTGVRPQCP
jgi:hypothetical protein